MFVNEKMQGRETRLSAKSPVSGEIVISTDLETVWLKICAGLRRDLGAQIFGQWIKPIKLSAFDSDTGILELELPSEFAATWVRDRYAERLLLAWKAHHPAVSGLAFRAQSGAAKIIQIAPGHGSAPQAANQSIPESKFRLDLDPRMTFDQFIAGHSNVLALNAAQRTAAADKPLFSPLYLQSSTGQGKTHLMHAIGHAFREEFPSATIIYMSAERFMIEFVSAMRRNDGIQGIIARSRPADGG